jgi:hypothetical protein
MNLGRTVFAQLVERLPRRAFDLAAERHRASGRRPLKLSCTDQLLCMIFAQLTGRSSLRETVTCLRAIGPRRYHLGIRHRPARSTLAEANERRNHRVFADTARPMIASARAELPVDDADLRRLGVRAAFALDATTIDLCLALFPWARFKRAKGAIKAHVLLDLNAGLPVFMRISHAKTSDVSTLDRLAYVPGAFYVLDRGYVDFARLHRLHRAGAFFVTRPKRKMRFRVTRRLPPDPARGVVRDRLIRLAGQKARRLGPWAIRQVRYVHPASGKRQAADVPDQPPDAGRVAGRAAVPQALEGRAALQVDEAAPAHQVLLRDDAQRGEGPAVDRGDHAGADPPPQAPARPAADAERNRADSERHPLRENPYKSGVLGRRCRKHASS